MDLASNVAIVTGASSGLGKAFSKALIKKGVTVYGLARSEDKLENIHQNFGNRFHPVTLDVTNHEKIEKWVSEKFSVQSSPDILVNNAGVGLFGAADQLGLNEWHP